MAQFQGMGPLSTQWQEVGDRILRRRYQNLDLNIGAIVTDHGVIVIDSRSNHEEGDELRAELKALSAVPLRWLVNTHVHWDHTFGNARFPEAVIVGHTRCRTGLLNEGEETKRTVGASDWIPEESKRAFAAVEITPPQLTFDEALTIYIADREVHLRYLGRGHTDSDIVVLIDDVCFAGDLIQHGVPPAFEDGFPRAWLDTLDRLAAMTRGTVVPGHGDLTDGAFIPVQRQEMAAAIEAAASGGGMSSYPPEIIDIIGARLGVENTDDQ